MEQQPTPVMHDRIINYNFTPGAVSTTARATRTLSLGRAWRPLNLGAPRHCLLFLVGDPVLILQGPKWAKWAPIIHRKIIFDLVNHLKPPRPTSAPVPTPCHHGMQINIFKLKTKKGFERFAIDFFTKASLWSFPDLLPLQHSSLESFCVTSSPPPSHRSATSAGRPHPQGVHSLQGVDSPQGA
jgi:hypothetical protein